MVLRRIASGGADAFYRGEIARAMADDIVDAGGHVTAAALAGYRAEDSRVVRGSYRGHELVGTFTPAAGAMTIGVLQIIENFDMAGADETTWALVVGQALALGFEAARTHRGPDAWQLLTSPEWAREQAERVRLPVAAAAMGPEPAAAPRGSQEPVAAYFAGPDDEGHTPHLSTADADGMAVALTQTIGPAMGSKIATPGLGFLYAATLGGYLGRLEAGERARSNIAPFMVLDGDDPMLVLGAAGGARIVSAVVQAVCRVIDQGLSLPEALAAARLHPMQGSLNPTGSESGFQMETSPDIGWSPEVIAELRQLGFAVQEVPRSGAFGRIHGMSYDATASSWTGAADPDWEGSVAAPRN